MSMFRALAPVLTIWAANPRALRIVLLDKDRQPQDLTGRTATMAIRRSSMLEPRVTVEAVLSSDGYAWLFLLAAQQCDLIYADGQAYGLSYDVIETYAGGSLRWTGRIDPQPASDLPGDGAAPALVDLPVAELVSETDTILITERGAAGFGVEKRLKDLGRIDEATPAAMDAYIRGLGIAGAQPFAEVAEAARDTAILQADRSEQEADRSQTQATLAQGQADSALAQADRAQTQADRSQTEADRSELAASASASAGRLYTTKEEGEAVTLEGDIFYTQSPSNNEVAIVWRMTGGVAVDTGKRTPSATFIDAAVAQVSADAASAAGAAATAVTAQSEAEDGAAESGAARDASIIAQGIAEAAAQTALLGANVFANKAAGEAVTANGQQFVAYGPAGAYATRYLMVAGAGVVQDSYPNRTALDTETSARQAADQASGAIALINVGGTGDAATAAIPAALNMLAIGNDTLFAIRWPATNTVADPTLQIGSTTYTVKGQRGQVIQPGRLAADSPYLLRRHSAGVLKVVSALGREDVGLFNVDNTSDVSKPVSTAQRSALNQSSVIHLGNVGGTGNAATAEFPGAFADHNLAIGEMVSLTWPALLTAAGPTLTLGGVTYTLITSRGSAIVSGRLEAGQSLTLRKTGATQLRAVNTLSANEIGLFNVDNTSDEAKPLSSAARAANTAQGQRTRAATRGYGEASAASSNFYSMQNGAVAISPGGGRVTGFSIPAGQTGGGTFITPRIALSKERAADLAGYTVRIVVKASVTSGFLAAHPLQGLVRVDRQNGDVVLSTGVLEEEVVEAGYLRRTVLYVMEGDEARIGQTIQRVASGSGAGVDHSLDIVSITIQPALDAVGSTVSAADMVARHAAEEQAAQVVGVSTLGAPGMSEPKQVTTTVQDAVDGAGGRTNALAYVQLPHGVVQERSIDSDGQIVLAGRGRHRTTLDGSLPDNAASADVAATSAIDAHRGTVVIRDQTIVMKNGRYAYHADDHVANARIHLANCDFVHMGNVAAGWTSQHGVGHGAWSGTEMEIEDCLLSGPRAGLQYHNNVDFAHPSKVTARRSRLVARNINAFGVIVEPLGSGVQDHLTLEDCQIVGNLFINCNQWFGTTYQPANHAAEIMVTGKGNTPAAAQVADFGRALRVTSATTGALSTVEIGGAAAALLFGARTYGRAGAAGVSGKCWGDVDINGSVLTGPSANINVSMGARLGNRASLGPMDLSITIDGTLRTVTFSGDYSASTNATILGIINTAISGLGVADEYAPGNRVRPLMIDEEETLLNESGTYIHWMAPLAFDGSRRNVRIMTDADPFTAFAGMCWEPDGIYPGEFGRVKRRGWISRDDLAQAGVENGAPAIAYGHWYVPFGTTGKVDADANIATYPDGVLQVVRFDAGQPATWTALRLRVTT
ncbi:hypothetical protein IWY39_000605 [Sphingobium sp. JAI105]|uniref:hypothetical protein n=1 Tax=Sphingobium sp. JAI105 TaxID=2787715 RepID=UPI0018CB3D6A|nr:hypothetical protein [Sphingobium sp. JAI105]MBG6116801.1 hypothetical protein [Sphingobium sp. JAI105]